ncbi:MAG: hypothetical protein GXO75_04940 [Calditrichaeota bacterium]|nr:hypothetical protein [Calditrichota bacterium]
MSSAEILDKLGIEYSESRGELWALCPLHEEDTPSFHMNAETGLWYCHGCGQGGNAFQLVKNVLGVGNAEARRWFGNDLPTHWIPSAKQQLRRLELQYIRLLYEAAANKIFSRINLNDTAPDADEYTRRLIADERFGLLREWFIRQLWRVKHTNKPYSEAI